MPDDARFRLVLRSLPSAVPAEVRLKAALKKFLRAYSFVCVEVCEVPAPAPPAAAGTDAKGDAP